jgi:hypothetical protein
MPAKEEEYVTKGEFERLQQDYQATLEALQEALDGSTALEAKIAELEPLATKAAELEGTLTGIKHEDAFKEIARELGINPAALKDAYKLGGWEAKGDPDPKAMKDHFTKALEGRDYLKGGDQGDGAGKQRKLPADENGSRGASRGDHTGKMRVSQAQLNDVNWMDMNMGKIAEATMQGNFELID